MRCAVVFNGETQLGDDPEGLVEEADSETNQDVNAPKLKHIIVTALKQEPNLLMDIQTLSFEAGTQNHTKPNITTGRWLKMETFNPFFFAVTTVYPVAELEMNPIMEAALENALDDVNTPTQTLFPTVAVIKNWIEAPFTANPETHTFVPLNPNIIPEDTPAETPLMAASEDESTKAAETKTEEEAGTEEITEHDDEGEEQLRWDIKESHV